MNGLSSLEVASMSSGQNSNFQISRFLTDGADFDVFSTVADKLWWSRVCVTGAWPKYPQTETALAEKSRYRNGLTETAWLNLPYRNVTYRLGKIQISRFLTDGANFGVFLQMLPTSCGGVVSVWQGLDRNVLRPKRIWPNSPITEMAETEMAWPKRPDRIDHTEMSRTGFHKSFKTFFLLNRRYSPRNAIKQRQFLFCHQVSYMQYKCQL